MNFNINHFINTPIPDNISLEGWQEVHIEECEEELTALYNIHPKITTNGDYLARKTVVNMLIEASKLLPVDCSFLIRDGYRSFDVQKKFYDTFYDKVKNDSPNTSEAEIIKQVTKKVTYPSKNPPSPHFTGGAIDMTIIDKNNEKLNMLTSDDYSQSDNTAFIEQIFKNHSPSLELINVAINRRLLYNIMTSIGFTNNPNEWWHYDFGNQFWAKIRGKKAIYGYIEEKK